MSARFFDPRPQITDENNVLLANGTIAFYDTETLDEVDFYSDADLTTAYDNPYTFGSDGRLPPIWLSLGKAYRVIIKDEDGVTLWDEDPYYGASVFGSLVSVESIAALRLLSTFDDGTVARVQSYYGDEKGGGGDFIWDVNSSATDNSGTVIKPTATVGNGRWLRPNQSYSTFLEFGAKADDATDNTDIFANAVDSVDTLYGEPGTYQGVFRVPNERNNFTAYGANYGTIIKCPAGPAQTVIDINGGGGEFPDLVTGISVKGFTADGNKANTTAPGDDINGYGVTLVAATNSEVDVMAMNCHLDGGYLGINAASNRFTVKSTNCGNAMFINIANYNEVNVVGDTCAGLVRFYDTSCGNTVKATGTSISTLGLSMGCQIVNAPSTGNIVDVAIDGDCSTNVVQIGVRMKENIVNITQKNSTGEGGTRFVGEPSIGDLAGPNIINGTDGNRYKCILNHVASASNKPITGVNYATYWVLTTDPIPSGGEAYAAWIDEAYYLTTQVPIGNTVAVNSYNNNGYAVTDEGIGNTVTINSQYDGQGFSPGNVNCLFLAGKRGCYNLNLEDTDPPRMIGWQASADAEDNEILSYRANDYANPYVDSGVRTKRRFQDSGMGVEIPKSDPLDPGLFPFGSIIPLSGGAVDINNITSPQYNSGRTVTFIPSTTGGTFNTGGANTIMTSAITMTANVPFTFICNGVKWIQQ